MNNKYFYGSNLIKNNKTFDTIKIDDNEMQKVSKLLLLNQNKGNFFTKNKNNGTISLTIIPAGIQYRKASPTLKDFGYLG